MSSSLSAFWRSVLTARQQYPIEALQLSKGGVLHGQEGQRQEVLRHIKQAVPSSFGAAIRTEHKGR